MRDYQHLAYAALAVIAEWRFRTGYSDADVVRCVAAIRLARTADGGESGLQPAVAENVLRHALGQDTPDTTDHVERFRAAIALLDALAEGALPDEENVDHLLTQARQLAGRWAANDQSLPADVGLRREPLAVRTGRGICVTCQDGRSYSTCQARPSPFVTKVPRLHHLRI